MSVLKPKKRGVGGSRFHSEGLKWNAPKPAFTQLDINFSQVYEDRARQFGLEIMFFNL